MVGISMSDRLLVCQVHDHQMWTDNECIERFVHDPNDPAGDIGGCDPIGIWEWLLTVPCDTCDGTGETDGVMSGSRVIAVVDCPDCTDGRRLRDGVRRKEEWMISGGYYEIDARLVEG